ncbi:Fe(3+) ABC transporter substrate-binding protein [Lysinibacillus sp. NPDC097162]|uniref:Fe(3+) ABC transporter substrate-binding protein n=1 Tax=unclassified Lysinibacillus TaxID=2636778 RepID=UPI00381D2A5E
MYNKYSSTFLTFVLVLVFVLAGCSANSSSQSSAKESSSAKTAEASNANNTESSKSGGEVNIYTARHYDVDKELYDQFTEQTGIKVNVVEGKAPELIERMKREGASTPADLFITVDGGILNSAKTEGILQPIVSDELDKQVPSDLRDKENHWIALSTRARVIVYAKDRVDPSQLSTYEDLATDKWKGKVVVRSSTNLYNQSMLASFIDVMGEKEAEAWAAGLVSNFAREPEGGDRDQAKAIVSGVGDVAILNTYYVGHMSSSDDAEEVKVAENIGVFFPNQQTTGTHINISGAGLVKHSKNKENALKLLEFLTAAEAQTKISHANYEFPVNSQATLPGLLESWGKFKHQNVDFAKYGELNPKAVEIANKVGWK